jgi:hypothetical protein
MMERGGSVARFSGDLAGKLDRRPTTALSKGGARVDERDEAERGLAVTFFVMDKPARPDEQGAGIGFTCAPALAGVSCAGRF